MSDDDLPPTPLCEDCFWGLHPTLVDGPYGPYHPRCGRNRPVGRARMVTDPSLCACCQADTGGAPRPPGRA